MNDYGFSKALTSFLLQQKDLMESAKFLFSHIPEESHPPYLHFQLDQFTEASPLPSHPKVSFKLHLDFYSTYKGIIEINGVMGLLSRLLEGRSLILKWKGKPGHVCLKEQSHSIRLLPDQQTRQGRLTFHCMLNFTI